MFSEMKPYTQFDMRIYGKMETTLWAFLIISSTVAISSVKATCSPAGGHCFGTDECCSPAKCMRHDAATRAVHMLPDTVPESAVEFADNAASGTCVSLEPSQGSACLVDRRPSTCGRGLMCDLLAESAFPLGMCVPPDQQHEPTAKYFGACKRTYDCNYVKQLCCTRHLHLKQNEEQICDYYEDPIADCLY